MRTRRGWLAAALLVVLFVLFVAPRPASASTSATRPFDAETELIARVNHERQARGVPPLAFHPAVSWTARDWTDHLAPQRALGHNMAFFSHPAPEWSAVGEVVGRADTVGQVAAMWMGSPSHATTILGEYTHVGAGVIRGADGLVYATLDFVRSPPCGGSVNPADRPSPAAASGYYVLGGDGGIFAFGDAPFRGSVPGLGVRAEAILMAVTPSQQGYWVLGSDGGVFSFGDARFHGSVPGLGVRGARAVDLKPTPSGNGYWVLGADGGVFSFGDARFHGSVPGLGVSNQAVRLVPTPSGNGYWVLGADGGVFSFGDARFHGSVPGVGQCVAARGVQLASTRTGQGYYVLSDRGEVFAFGDAPDYGAPAAYRVRGRDLAVVSR